VRRRFEKRIYIALPDEPGRNKLLERKFANNGQNIHTNLAVFALPVNLGEEAKNFNEEHFKEIVARTDG